MSKIEVHEMCASGRTRYWESQSLYYKWRHYNLNITSIIIDITFHLLFSHFCKYTTCVLYRTQYLFSHYLSPKTNTTKTVWMNTSVCICMINFPKAIKQGRNDTSIHHSYILWQIVMCSKCRGRSPYGLIYFLFGCVLEFHLYTCAFLHWISKPFLP